MKRPAFSGDWPIPKRIDLPGMRVRVRVVPPGESSVASKFDGVFMYDVEKSSAVILVDGSLPLEVQRYVVLHELLHAANEAADVALEHFPDLVMPKSVAVARGLIEAPKAPETAP